MTAVEPRLKNLGNSILREMRKAGLMAGLIAIAWIGG